jgi:hypothetical protein
MSFPKYEVYSGWRSPKLTAAIISETQPKGYAREEA